MIRHLYAVIRDGLAVRASILRIERATVDGLTAIMSGDMQGMPMAAVVRAAELIAVLNAVPQQPEAAPVNDRSFKTRSGARVAYADIPKDAAGNVEPAWLNEHCACGETHNTAWATGQYL